MAANPFLLPYVAGVQPVDFKNEFQTSDAATLQTDQVGIGIPTRDWMDWLRNPLGSAMSAAGEAIQSWLVRGAFVVLGLMLIIFAVWTIARGPNTIQIDMKGKAA
jgi:hypothetical protein